MAGAWAARACGFREPRLVRDRGRVRSHRQPACPRAGRQELDDSPREHGGGFPCDEAPWGVLLGASLERTRGCCLLAQSTGPAGGAVSSGLSSLRSRSSSRRFHSSLSLSRGDKARGSGPCLRLCGPGNALARPQALFKGDTRRVQTSEGRNPIDQGAGCDHTAFPQLCFFLSGAGGPVSRQSKSQSDSPVTVDRLVLNFTWEGKRNGLAEPMWKEETIGELALRDFEA